MKLDLESLIESQHTYLSEYFEAQFITNLLRIPSFLEFIDRERQAWAWWRRPVHVTAKTQLNDVRAPFCLAIATEISRRQRSCRYGYGQKMESQDSNSAGYYHRGRIAVTSSTFLDMRNYPEA